MMRKQGFRFSSYFIKNGKIINPDRVFKGDVLIQNNKIKGIIDYSRPGSSNEVIVPKEATIFDAKDRYLIPGGIDTHTHMELKFMGEVASDDFDKGTKAAISGGTTTIIDFLMPDSDGSLVKGYNDWRQKADGKVNCDYALHCILTKFDDATKKEMEEITKLGVQSFKIFLAYKGSLMMEESQIFQILRRAKELGALTLVHSENGNLIDATQKYLTELGINGPEGHYLSRPESFEALATHQAITVAEYLSAPLYVVHLMSKDSADEVLRARRRGAPIFGETLAAALGIDGRQLWNKNWDIAASHVMSPPINPDPTVKEYLMKNIHIGNIHTVGSDNCTFCLSQKRRGKDSYTKIPNGVNGVEDRLAILWTLGVKKGLISETEFVKSTSTNAAQIFNMYPNKGIIQEGADADIVIWNGDKERVISKETHHHNLDYNVFEGIVVNGTAEQTFSGGKLVYDHVLGYSNQNKGRYIPRQTHGFSYDRIDALTESRNPLKRKVDRSELSSQKDDVNPAHPEFEEIRKLRNKVSELTKQLNSKNNKI